MKPSLIPAAVLLLCTATASAWAAPGTVLRNEKLYSQPSASAKVDTPPIRPFLILASPPGSPKFSRVAYSVSH